MEGKGKRDGEKEDVMEGGRKKGGIRKKREEEKEGYGKKDCRRGVINGKGGGDV